MKTIAMLLLLFTVGSLRAEEPSKRDSGPSEKVSVRNTDIDHIELDTQTGRISFTALGMHYVLPGNANGFEGVAVAKLGILNELRRCDQVTLSVVPLGDSSSQQIIKGMVLKYDTLKP